MNLFDNYTGLYFYSAVFQGNMALLAFTGVFVVFRLQLLSQAIQYKEAEVINFMINCYDNKPQWIHQEVRSHFDDLKNIKFHIQTLLDNRDWQPSNRGTLEALQQNFTFSMSIEELKKIENQKKNIISKIKFPFGSLLAVVILSLILLLATNYIHTTNFWLEICMFILTLLLNIWALYINVKFIFKTVVEYH